MRKLIFLISLILCVLGSFWGDGTSGETFASSGFPDLSNAEWRLLGPLSYSAADARWDTEYEKDYLTELGGEPNAKPALLQKTAGKKWTAVRANRGQVDFGKVYGELAYYLAYAYLEFQSDSSETVALKLGSDDGLKVWFNGKLMLTNQVKRSLRPNDEAVRIQPKPGINRLLLKIVQITGPSGFIAQLRPVSEENNERQKTKLLGYRINVNQYSPQTSLLNLLVSTSPALAVKEPVELVFKNQQGEKVARFETWTGEPVSLKVPSGLSGVTRILITGRGGKTCLTEEATVLIGDVQLIVKETIALARRAAQKVTSGGKGEDVSATLSFLADQLEGKLHPSLTDSKRNLRAIHTITELCMAVKNRPWQIGSKHGIRQWAYYSPVDGSAQPYTVYLPEGYTSKRKYNLLVNLHGYSGNDYDSVNKLVQDYHPDDFIVVAPFGRGDLAYASVGEQDVLDVIDLVQRTYSVDPDRVFLMGSSMGGCGAWRIGQFYSDRFAAVAPFCGWTNTKYLENLHHLPVLIVHGSADTSVPVENSRTAAAYLLQLEYQVRYDEIAGVGHSALDGWIAKNGIRSLFEYFRRFRRNSWPDRVSLTIPYLRFGKHYWVRIEDRKIQSEPASLNARVLDERHLTINTNNLTAFSVDLRHPKLAKTGRVVIDVDGYYATVDAGYKEQLLTYSEDQGRFVKAARPPGALVRHEGGGLADLFTGPLYIVYGTKGRAKVLKQVAERLADWSETEEYVSGTKAGRFRVIADRAVTESILKKANLLCIGTTAENALTAKLSQKSPVRFLKDEVEILGRKYHKTGLAMVYPNPYQQSRLVGIISFPFKDGDLVKFFTWLNFNLRAYALDDGVGSFITPDVMLFSAIDKLSWKGSFDLYWKQLKADHR